MARFLVTVEINKCTELCCPDHRSVAQPAINNSWATFKGEN
jgi:hypothetical protein